MTSSSDVRLDDPEFLIGLEAILAPYKARGASTEELNAITARARDFYASQRASTAAQPAHITPTPVASTSQVNGVPEPTAQPAYPSSFNDLAALIASGAPPPGIKTIPDRLNEAPTTKAQLAGRPKPWEQQAPAAPPTVRYIFGYGSLIWKPPPHAIRRQPGYIKGFVRRFAQSSSDHRGTPEAPGRVVTLVPSDRWRALSPDDVTIGEDDRVWGVAYEIDPAYATEVRQYLDHREKDGYSVSSTDVWHGDEVVIPQATVYVGHPDNPSFVGPSPLQQLAAHIHRSSGPSGENKVYLYNLASALREVDKDSEDEYLFSLERAVRALDVE